MDDHPSRSPLPRSYAYGNDDDDDDLDSELDDDHPLALPYHPYSYVGDITAAGIGDDSSRSSSPERRVDDVAYEVDVDVVSDDDEEEEQDDLESYDPFLAQLAARGLVNSVVSASFRRTRSFDDFDDDDDDDDDDAEGVEGVEGDGC